METTLWVIFFVGVGGPHANPSGENMPFTAYFRNKPPTGRCLHSSSHHRHQNEKTALCGLFALAALARMRTQQTANQPFDLLYLSAVCEVGRRKAANLHSSYHHLYHNRTPALIQWVSVPFLLAKGSIAMTFIYLLTKAGSTVTEEWPP